MYHHVTLLFRAIDSLGMSSFPSNWGSTGTGIPSFFPPPPPPTIAPSPKYARVVVVVRPFRFHHSLLLLPPTWSLRHSQSPISSSSSSSSSPSSTLPTPTSSCLPIILDIKIRLTHLNPSRRSSRFVSLNCLFQSTSDPNPVIYS